MADQFSSSHLKSDWLSHKNNNTSEIYKYIQARSNQIESDQDRSSQVESEQVGSNYFISGIVMSSYKYINNINEIISGSSSRLMSF